MDPQQELFTALLTALRTVYPSAVYDGILPPEETPYPFVYLADSVLTDEQNKSCLFGTVEQTIHVWHNDPHKRGTVSGMLLEIKRVCRQIEHTNNFGWDVRNIEQRIMSDDTTDQPLLHGVLDVRFYFS